MKTIVITGSSRGIGFGLAERFLEGGHNVVISGLTRETLDKAYGKLKEQFTADRIHAVLCDTTKAENHENLWRETISRFGRVDLWINNAGIGQPNENFDQLDREKISRLVETNVIGLMFGTQTAYRHMKEQGGGQIYNMEGFGSNGAKMAGLSLYGTSKCAVNYFNSSFIMETKGSPIITGSINPGMVMTDFIIQPMKNNPERLKKMAFIIDIIADEVKPVTRYLARRILNNKKHGTRIKYTSVFKMLFHFLTTPFARRNLVEKYMG